MKRVFYAFTTLVLASAIGHGCREGPDEAGAAKSEHGHAHGEGGHGDHGDQGDHGDHDKGHGGGHEGHGHGHDGASEVVTLWGATTQLFVEFPALVVGEDSPFAAHLTRLKDHDALAQGEVVVELSGGGHPVERFAVGQPSVPGIFRPVVRPAHPGPRDLTLRLASSGASEIHRMGRFVVFETRAKADKAAKKGEEDPGEISFLLEQQWKIPFRVEQARARKMRPHIPAFARLKTPDDAQTLVAAPRDGRLVAVGGRFPVVGEEVTGAEVLFRLQIGPREGAEPATLELAVEQATIGLRAARREVRRLKPLVSRGVVAKRRLDEARSTVAVARAELRSARRQRQGLDRSQKLDGKGPGLKIPSPMGGTIAELLAAPGAWVAKGQPLVRIVDRDRLWLDVGVPEAWIGRLKEISGAWFRLDGAEGVVELPRSALVSVGTEVDPKTRTLSVRFRIDNVRRDLFAGTSTQAHLVIAEPTLTVTVPADAVVDDSGTDVVYVQTGGESFVRRPVRLGMRDGDFIEVIEGVAPREWVVTRGGWTIRLASTSTEAIGHGHAH